MPVKKSTSKKTLSEIRAENMAKWTAEDYKFYSDFLADVPLKKKKPQQEVAVEEQEEVIKE